MNRNKYRFLFESILAFVFLILHFQAFSQNTYYTKNLGTLLFNDASNWSSTANGLGSNPAAAELTGTTLANFVVQDNAKVSFTNDVVKIGTLVIGLSCQVHLNNSTVEVTGALTMAQFSTIDFKTQTSTLTINGNLNGTINTSIIHSADPNMTQKLILKGKNNILHTFEYETGASNGNSIVSYEGANQDVIVFSNYSTLLIGGTGTKTLVRQSFNSTIAGVQKKLELKTKLQLGALDLRYEGTESNLTYGAGWIWTDGTGAFKNIAAASSLTFPVGDNIKMEALQLSNISDNTIVYGVRYGASNGTNASVPNNGMGVWYINASDAAKLPITVSLIDPANVAATVSSASKIAAYTNSAWETQTTIFTSNTKTYQTNYIIAAGANSFALFDCASLTVSPTTTPIAFQGVSYSTPYPYLKVSNGVPSYSIVQYSSTPTDFNTYISDAENGTIYITGTPNTVTTYQINFKVSDATKCATTFNYTIDVRKPVTVYNGTSWSNGEPFSSIDAIFAGNYTTPALNSVNAKNITVNAGVTVTLANNSGLIAANNITNKGTITNNCTSTITYATYSGITPVEPTVNLGSLTYGVTNQPFNQSVAISNIIPTGPSAAPIYTMSPSIPDITMNSATGILSGTPKIANTYAFTINYKYGNCTTSKSYSLAIIDPISPNLYITPIDTKTFGDADFVISTYSKNTATPITYSISPINACAQFTSSNTLSITCAGASPKNTITITATQAGAGLYKTESTTTTFFINKAPAKLTMKNTGFLPNTTGVLLTDKISDGTPIYTQLTGGDLATVTSTGQVTTFGSTGTFSVAAKIDATNNYNAFDSIYTFTIYTLKKAPVAVNDTIVIEMGQDTTLNMVLNDYGITDPVNSTLTDIDIENIGIQKKYYSTLLGTFTIDPAGILSINPFEGFIGTDAIGYTVTDEGGLTSNIAYLIITVKEPVIIPELKANEVMTPNNDGLNDALVIANTNIESNNHLLITDEVGNIVFEQDNYRNDWKGLNKRGDSISSGIYFYMFTEKSSGRILQNYVQISGR